MIAKGKIKPHSMGSIKSELLISKKGELGKNKPGLPVQQTGLKVLMTSFRGENSSKARYRTKPKTHRVDRKLHEQRGQCDTEFQINRELCGQGSHSYRIFAIVQIVDRGKFQAAEDF